MKKEFDHSNIEQYFQRTNKIAPIISEEKVHQIINMPKVQARLKGKTNNLLKFTIMTTLIAIVLSTILFWPKAPEEIPNLKRQINKAESSLTVKSDEVSIVSSKHTNYDAENNDLSQSTSVTPTFDSMNENISSDSMPTNTSVNRKIHPFKVTNIAYMQSSKNNWMELVFLESKSFKIGEKDSSIWIALNSGIPNKPARGTYYFSEKDAEQLPLMTFNGQYYPSKDSVLKINGGKLLVDTIGKNHSFHFEFLLANNQTISGEFVPEPYKPTSSINTKPESKPKDKQVYAKQILDSTLFIRLNKSELEQLGFVSNDNGFEMNYKLGSTNWFVSYYNHMLTFGAKSQDPFPKNNTLVDSAFNIRIQATNLEIKTNDKSASTAKEGIAPLVITDNDGKKMLQMSIPEERVLSYFSKKFNKDYRTLLPVVVPKNTFNNQPEQDIVFWFLPSDEFFNLLPQRISDELLAEYEYITAEDKSALVQPECKYFDECKNTLELSNFKVFPNPANRKATLSFALIETINGKISLVDLAGRERQILQTQTTMSSGDHSFELDLNEVPEGIYLITLFSDRGIQTKRLIVSH